nr:hypothetical protein JVH1_7395 [Rhodococcus sp. JVH1]
MLILLIWASHCAPTDPIVPGTPDRASTQRNGTPKPAGDGAPRGRAIRPRDTFRCGVDHVTNRRRKDYGRTPTE